MVEGVVAVIEGVAVSHPIHVRPMFELARWPMLGAFSQLLEAPRSDNATVQLCLRGFEHAVHVACIFYMATERDAFIGSLYKFTQLSTLREMRPRSICAINTLLRVALNEANYLQSTWHLILTCTSQVRVQNPVQLCVLIY